MVGKDLDMTGWGNLHSIESGDCSHWLMPGVPDLLGAEVVRAAEGAKGGLSEDRRGMIYGEEEEYDDYGLYDDQDEGGTTTTMSEVMGWLQNKFGAA